MILDTVDIPHYKAIVVQAPDANNPLFSDTRLVDYNLPNNAGVGELNGVSGHITPLKWNQTVPSGIKRIIPIANVSAQDGSGNVSSASPEAFNNTTPTGIADLDTNGQAGSNATDRTRTVDADIAVLDTGIKLIILISMSIET